jgi:acetylglutamate kinase
MEHKYTSPSATRPIVIKYGGHALTATASNAPCHPEPVEGSDFVTLSLSKGRDYVLSEAVALHLSGTPVVLVHGGGPEIDRWLQARNIPTRRVDGLRVTDEVTLEITEAVLCATINKQLVRACSVLGARAAGISGEDGATLVAQRAFGSKGEDLGYVGDVTGCDARLIDTLLAAGYLPVVAPLAVAADSEHAYNVNADLAAAAVAGALRAAFVIVTDVPRVLRDPNDPASEIAELSLDRARAFARTPACSGGMQPKIRAAITAVESGAPHAYICAASERTIIGAINGGNATIIS